MDRFPFVSHFLEKRPHCSITRIQPCSFMVEHWDAGEFRKYKLAGKDRRWKQNELGTAGNW